MSVVRAWINQPSGFDPYHRYHGINVLYDSTSKRAYFLDGDVISMHIHNASLVLSHGWKTPR